MAPRNLHEAFEQAENARRRSGASEAPRPASAARPIEPASAGRGDREPTPLPDLRGILRHPIVWVVLLTMFGMGYLAGRGSSPTSKLVDEALAADSGLGHLPLAKGPRVLVPTESLGDSYLHEMEDELYDLRNQYTVQVVSYSRSDRNLGFAQDLVSHLASRDIPVALPQKVVDDKYFVVLVGASPTKEALAALEARVRVLDDAAGKKSFGDARIIQIDSLLSR